jgi:hypothetical protein
VGPCRQYMHFDQIGRLWLAKHQGVVRDRRRMVTRARCSYAGVISLICR